MKAFRIVGTASGATTVRFTVPLTAPATGVSAVVTPVVALGYVFAVLLVTSNVTVQVMLFAGIVIPLKLCTPDDPTVSVFEPAPAQVPPTVPVPPTFRSVASVSVNEALVSGDGFALVNVRVTVEVPPA